MTAKGDEQPELGTLSPSVTGTLRCEHGTDVTAYLTLWIILLFGISARQVLPGFGAIGSPGLLMLLPAAAWWIASRAVPSLGADHSPSVTRFVLLIYTWYLLVSYALSRTRPLTTLETTGSTRAAITAIALTGLALLVLDGVTSTTRLITLMRRVVWGGGAMALIGALQFFTGETWRIPIPGLQWNAELAGEAGVEMRSIFNRPSGTTLHPIEFSVVTAALVPLAVHFAMFSARGPRRQAAIAATILLALGVPFAISRSGVLALVVVFAVMFGGWTWRQRANGALLVVGAIPLLWAMVPGLVGTIRSMFTWFDDDPSIQARRDRVPRIMEQMRENPWFGLGHGTWSIEDYFLIDNQFYVTLLEGGIVGLVMTAMLLTVGLITGLAVKHAPYATDEHASLGRAMTAGIAGITVSIVTFDAFHYLILTSMLLLFIGANGALLRLTSSPPAAPAARHAAPEHSQPHTPTSRLS